MTMWARVRRVVFGPPKDVNEPHAFHKLSLIAFLAWVGLGADGLSSSAYGPEETFRQLGEHVHLAVFLAAAMIATVFIISYGYSRIIEQFPSGGGGYLVASKVLGGPAGVVAGSALLVDYVSPSRSRSPLGRTRSSVFCRRAGWRSRSPLRGPASCS